VGQCSGEAAGALRTSGEPESPKIEADIALPDGLDASKSVLVQQQ
jgi:hypothetical protein